MTLLDAPRYDEKRARRHRMILSVGSSTLLVLIIAWWLVAGRPVDFPWNWNAHLMGRITVNRFFAAVEKNDLSTAYGIWVHDKDWQRHAAQHIDYPFARFQSDWGGSSPDNDYGPIRSHRIAATHMRGNVLLVGIFVNGRKSKAVNLDYDPQDKTLNFSPEDVRFLEGPGGIS
jgi:hypothetical protein